MAENRTEIELLTERNNGENNEMEFQQHNSYDVLEIENVHSDDELMHSSRDCVTGSLENMDVVSNVSSTGKTSRRMVENECKAVKVRIENIEKTLTQNFINELPIEGIELHLKQLEMYYAKFMDCHMQRIGMCVNESDQQLMYDEHTHIDSCYMTISQALQVRLNWLKCRELDVSSSRASHSQFPSIDKIRLEKFDGDSKRWVTFKSMFTQLVHDESYESAAKLNCLSNHLVLGTEPHDIIDGFSGDGGRYQEAWKTLCEYYDDLNRQVTSHIERFLDWPRIEIPNRTNLMQLVTRTKHLIMSLPKYGIDMSSWDAIFVVLLTRKIDDKTKVLWIRERTQKQVPELKPFLDFITVRANSLESRDNGSNNQLVFAKPSNTFERRTHSSGNKLPVPILKRQLCPMCSGPHRLFECIRYIKLTSNIQRKETCVKLKVCFACLRKDCSAAKCTMHRCKCGMPHNSSICPTFPWRVPELVGAPAKEEPRPYTSGVAAAALAAQRPLQRNGSTGEPIVLVSEPIQSINSLTDFEYMQAHNNDNGDGTLLATMRVNAANNSNRITEANVLCDNGSQLNFITENLVNRLRIPRKTSENTIFGINNVAVRSKGVVRIKLFSTDMDFCVEIDAIILPNITAAVPNRKFNAEAYLHIRNLRLADNEFNCPKRIDLLIGAHIVARIVCNDIRRGQINEPISQLTKFGWIIYGPINQAIVSSSKVFTVKSEYHDDSALERCIAKLWELEEAPKQKYLTDEEKFCEMCFVSSVNRLDNGRYIVDMPIASDAPELGESRFIAVKQLKQNQQKYKSKPWVMEAYNKFMEEYEQLGHMREVAPLGKNESGYYIPHQGGLWEAAVKSIKQHLAKLIGSQILTVDDMRTLLTEISGYMNSRPLVPIYDGPDATTAITPGHFLIGEQIVAPVIVDSGNSPKSYTKRYAAVQHLSQELWERWEKEYVTQLIKRHKWKQPIGNVQIGDIVLVKYEDVAKVKWPLGRITNVYADSHGRVRNVELKMNGKLFNRPVNKLCILQVNEHLEN